MTDFFLAAVKIAVIDFLMFFIFDRYLVKCLLANHQKRWSVTYAIAVFLIMVSSRLLNQSPTFAFFLALSLYIFLMGWSANYQGDKLLKEAVEVLTAKTRKYVIFASILGYLSYATLVTK